MTQNIHKITTSDNDKNNSIKCCERLMNWLKLREK